MNDCNSHTSGRSSPRRRTRAPRRCSTLGDKLGPFNHRRRHLARREPILITISAKPDGICLGGAPQCAVASPERRRHELRAWWSVAMVLGRPPALHWLAWRQPATRRGQRRAKPGRRRFRKGGDNYQSFTHSAPRARSPRHWQPASCSQRGRKNIHGLGRRGGRSAARARTFPR